MSILDEFFICLILISNLALSLITILEEHNLGDLEETGELTENNLYLGHLLPRKLRSLLRFHLPGRLLLSLVFGSIPVHLVYFHFLPLSFIIEWFMKVIFLVQLGFMPLWIID